jgi:chromosome segregation ATPase
MHIKRLNFENFVSYDKFPFPGDLSPGLNLFLGANGSGKSNFL